MSDPSGTAYRVSTVNAEDLDLVTRVFDAVRVSWQELAEMAGTKRYNLLAYATGRTRMPDERRLALAARIYLHAQELEALADELAASCDEDE